MTATELITLHKKVVEYILTILMVIFLIRVYHFFYGSKVVGQDTKQLQEQIDSFNLREKNRVVEINLLQEKIKTDSLRITNLTSYVNTTNSRIDKIKTKYNEKTNTLIQLPFNQQFLYFANWLSQDTGTTTK